MCLIVWTHTKKNDKWKKNTTSEFGKSENTEWSGEVNGSQKSQARGEHHGQVCQKSHHGFLSPSGSHHQSSQ